jgi:hypothetical protein
MADRHLNYCKDCVIARERQSRSHPESRVAARAHYRKNREKVLAKLKRWHDKNPERNMLVKRAARAVTMALRAGVIARKDACEHCGATDRRIEAAHKNYVDVLDVLWLCARCHRVWDCQPKTHEYTNSLVSTFEVAGKLYTAIFERDPRLPDDPARWVIYGNSARFRAVETSPGKYAIISDRSAGFNKPLRKGPLREVKLRLEDDKLVPF